MSLWHAATELLLTDHGVAPGDLYIASVGLSNLAFLLSLILVPILPRRTPAFVAGAIVYAFTALDVLAWFLPWHVHPEFTNHVGALVWASAHGVLWYAFVAAARHVAAETGPLPSNSAHRAA